MAPAGAVTTSPSTTTTISTVTRILAVVIACRIYRLVAPGTVAASETGRRINLQAGVAETTGRTIRNIVAALPTETEPRRTGLVARRGVIPLQIDRPARANRLAARAAIWPATAQEPPALVIERVLGLEGAAGRAGDRTASEAGTFRAAGEETEMRLAAVPGVPGATTDRAPGPAAVAVPRVWALEAEASVGVAVAAGADRPTHSELMGV